MTPDEARTIVLCKYPDAEARANDFDWHWIDRKPLSEAFQEDKERTQKWMDMPHETDAECDLSHEVLKSIQQTAKDEAWLDAAQKILKETL